MVFHETTLSRKEIFKGKIINVHVDKIRTKDGGESFREIVEHPGGVAVVALVNGKMVLVKQFRKAADKVLLEIPAGKIEKGESPEKTAVRELKEETGYTATRIKHLFTFYSSPGFSSEKIYLYLAENLISGDAEPDENEHVEMVQYDIDTLLKMIEKGEIIDGKTIVAIQVVYNLKMNNEL